jgi:SAM-dependent methyltransferase
MSDRPSTSIAAMSDLRTPWCIHVAATLRIAEHISAGTTDVPGLAEWATCDAAALHRVLTHLAYHELYGRPFWEDLDAHPDIAASFDALIGPVGHGTPNASFEIEGGWAAVRTVVDVGGGTGALLAELLRLHPHLRGTLVDLPRAVARASDIFRASGVSERAVTVGQSFFDPLPARADVYLLKSVLNDWPDPEAIRLLTRCAEAARPAGRVVVLSGVSDTSEGPRGIEIEMVLCGGQHRTLDRFRDLARAASLEVAVAERQSSGYFVVECRPAQGDDDR